MKKQAFNPYLPLDTYIPDGESHVFCDRVYIYGSHDAEGGDCFCLLDYECWSAPVDELSDWRCEGIIYRAEQCKHYCKERQALYAMRRMWCGETTGADKSKISGNSTDKHRKAGWPLLWNRVPYPKVGIIHTFLAVLVACKNIARNKET